MTALCFIYTTFRISAEPGTLNDPLGSARFRPSRRVARTGSALYAPALARPATVVRDWRHVADGGDREPHRLQRTQSALAARARPADLDFQHLHAVLAGLLASILGSDLGGVRRGLAAAFESLAAGGRPGDGVALRVGDGDYRVVER